MQLINAAKLVIIVKDEVLLLRNSLTHPHHPHWNDLPGGVVEAGESTEQGMMREIEEEIGLKLDTNAASIIYADTEYFSHIQKVYVNHIYIYRAESKPEIQLSWEHDDYKWTNKSDLKGLSPAYQRGIDFASKHNLL